MSRTAGFQQHSRVQCQGGKFQILYLIQLKFSIKLLIKAFWQGLCLSRTEWLHGILVTYPPIHSASMRSTLQNYNSKSSLLMNRRSQNNSLIHGIFFSIWFCHRLIFLFYEINAFFFSCILSLRFKIQLIKKNQNGEIF